MRTIGKGREIVIEPLQEPVPKRKEAKPDLDMDPMKRALPLPEREKVPVGGGERER